MGKATSTKAAKPTAKDIKPLVDALGSRYASAEALQPWVDGLKTEKGLAIVEGALARVKEGGRRMYLAAKLAEAKGDAKGAAKLANEVCKKFAKLPAEAEALAMFFCNVAPLATDVPVVHAAVRTLAAFDPYYYYLLPIAAANADARGDGAEAAMWRERAATIERLRPLLLGIRKDTEAQTRAAAVADVDRLPDEDRRFVFRRILWRPAVIDEALVSRAIEATLDDHDGVPAATWIAAVGELGDDDEDSAMSKTLRARLATDATATSHLVRRMIEADEAAPVAGGDDEDLDEGDLYKGLCTGFFALRERAAEPGVYALVDRALQGGKERVRLQRAVLETFLHGLQCGPAVWPTLTDAQRRETFAWLLAAARKGPHENEAQHALFYWAGAGVEDLVEEALDKEKIEEVVDNLYSVARNIGARDLLVRRLQREKHAFWRLQDAIGEAWTPAWHATLLDQIDAWGDARVAEIYLEALRDHVKKRAPLIELVRRVLVWKPSSGDAARYKKRILIEGTRVAIDAHDYALAREAWEASQAIKAAPLSNEYTTERKSKVPDPFADKEAKATLKKLLSGELEKAAERIKQKAAAARAAGKPQRASDDVLAALAGANVELRVFEDPVTRQILFVDGEDELRFYDGFELGPLPWRIQPLAELRGALADATVCDERALAWDKPANTYREVVRWGPCVMLLWGQNNDYSPKGRIVVFDDAAAAHAFYETVKAGPPDGFTYGSPYFVEGKGGVAREYIHDEAGEETSTQAVLGDRWGWGNHRFDSPAEAERMYEGWELESYKRGSRLKNLEWMERLKRDQDRTLCEWLEERARDDSASIAWHIDALADMERVLRAQGVWPEGAEVFAAPAPPPDEIDRFAAEVEVLPAHVRELWQATGGAGWKLGGAAHRLHGPSEALAFRPKMHAWLDEASAKWGAKKAHHVATWRSSDVLVVDQDGMPILLARCKKDAGDALFASPEVGAKPDDAYWTDGLGWHIAITFNDGFVRALAGAEPLLFVLKYGQAAPAERKTVTLTSGDKVWSAILDEAAGTFYTVAGKRDGARRVATKKHATAAAARKAFDAAVKSKRAEGFRA